MQKPSFHRIEPCLCIMILAIGLVFPKTATADSWKENKANIEWSFKLGAVKVALEKCPFQKGPRFAELTTNAGEDAFPNQKRTLKEGREFMMILDGPDLTPLCATAWKFYGPNGKDLKGVLATTNAPAPR